MALIDKISNVLAFGGAKPAERAGAKADNDLHFDKVAKTHVGGHTQLELQAGAISKYTDNLPK